MNSYNRHNDTICAPATAQGIAAISLIRLSGPESHRIIRTIFTPVSTNADMEHPVYHKLYFGTISNEEGLLDEVMVSLFKAPHSYTGEDAAEISCHGSVFIQQQLLALLLNKGARLAEPGEFTMRAYLNGRFDLAQAEAVADLIASQSKNAHRLAMNQMRGGISERIGQLRQQLLDFASLIELELDFSEEDVEFADRPAFFRLLAELRDEIKQLIESFGTGNAIRNGIPVAIIGKPNVGKSTLLNAILNEEKAIVSDIPGTTRDAIEDTIVLGGYTFRFIDTAGLRESDDMIENMGIERTYEKIRQATIILYVCDLSACSGQSAEEMLSEFRSYVSDNTKHFILVGNKIDQLGEIPPHFSEMVEMHTVFVSAKRRENIHLLAESLLEAVKDLDAQSHAIVSNIRHLQALQNASAALQQVEEGFRNGLPTDLAAIDLRDALYHLGSITGQISSDEILGNIFGKFCIGK